MAYTADKPKTAFDSDVLRNTITGWGVDLDPRDRPGVPKERFDPQATGAHWVFPERQVPTYNREKTTEHKFLTPVFGTVCPPKGLSGLVRRLAYRYSEGQTTHWTLLMLADRIDVIESRAAALLRGRPDNLLLEAGLRSEITGHGLRSRVGQHRADLMHQPIDVMLAAGKGLAVAAAVFSLGRALSRVNLRAAR